MITLQLSAPVGYAYRWNDETDAEVNISSWEAPYLDGIKGTEQLSAYIEDDPDVQHLAKIASEGVIELRFYSGILNVHVVYQLTEKLGADDVALLKEYTLGQLSDGVGANFEGEPCFKDIYVQVWSENQTLEIQ